MTYVKGEQQRRLVRQYDFWGNLTDKPLKDDPERAKKLVAYLEQYEVPESIEPQGVFAGGQGCAE